MIHPEPPRLSVLIPLYNEADCLIENVHRLLRLFSDRSLRGEIILGSNGSTDSTPIAGRILQEAYPDTIRFFHLERRGAVGEVFRVAAKMASSPLLVSMDADLSVEPEKFVERALPLLGEHDVVVGSKQSGSQSRSIWRRAGSGAFILCAGMLLKLPFDDYSLGAKAYRIEHIAPFIDSLSDDTNYVLELIHRCHHAGLSIAVLPVACEDWRKSRFRLFREALVRFSHLFGFFWATRCGSRTPSGLSRSS